MSNSNDSPKAAEHARQDDKKSTEMNHTQSNGKQPKPRHRASVACAQCRDRRIRCVVPAGDSECTQCKRAGVDCVIKNDDERRRPISRAYMCSLTERVALLEGMLKDTGTEPPAANYPPKTRHGTHPDETNSSPQRSSKNNANGNTGSSASSQRPPSIPEEPHNSSPGSQQDDFFMDLEHEHLDGDSRSLGDDENDSANAPSPPVVLPPPRKDGMVSRLLSTRGHLSFDQLSGRLRYFGPTTNCHVHSELGGAAGPNETRESVEQARRAEKTIRQLPMETHDYLMSMFWTHYNSVIHVLHQDAFYEDRENGRSQYYSGFLHICVLAMGYRVADKSRPDMQRLTVAPRESSLHREAKFMLEFELERTGGLPSIVALLLLGDLECGVGRDNLGWLYAGMAVRLAFDLGLHLDSRNSGLPEREIEIRHMTLWACWIYDKYWSLFLGRPTSIKNSDLEIYSLSKHFERLGTCRPAGVEKSVETQIYEALLDLMELAGKITENAESQGEGRSIDRNAYLRMAALDRELGVWYAKLPEALRWTPQNIQHAPVSFFLLHQQYHTALILLHRPFASYEEPSSSSSISAKGNNNASSRNANGGGTTTPDDGEDSSGSGDSGGDAGADHHFSALSRTVCTKHAVRVARIFWQHKQRFDTKQIFVTGMQHAGTAATALVAALAFIKNPHDRIDNMQYLECLSAAMTDMSYNYQPAERMSIVLQAVMLELRTGPRSRSPPTRSAVHYNHRKALIPARRGSSADDSERVSFKRRQTSRTKSFSTVRSSMSIDINGLQLSMPPPRSRADLDREESDGSYMLATPRSDISAWPGSVSVNGDSIHSHSHSHNHLSSFTSTTPRPNSSSTNAWMGALHHSSDMDTTDINTIAVAHFPEMMHLSEEPGAGTANGNGSDGQNPNSHLDFLNLGGDDWKSWDATGANGGMGDLDGFPSQGFGFSGQSPAAVAVGL